ncbi:hypothetical protein RQP46_003978 [Phenoliferia psychrophenolica]
MRFNWPSGVLLLALGVAQSVQASVLPGTSSSPLAIRDYVTVLNAVDVFQSYLTPNCTTNCSSWIVPVNTCLTEKCRCELLKIPDPNYNGTTCTNCMSNQTVAIASFKSEVPLSLIR